MNANESEDVVFAFTSSRLRHVRQAATKAQLQLHLRAYRFNIYVSFYMGLMKQLLPWIQFLALSDNAPFLRTPLAHVMSAGREQIMR